MTKKIRFFWRTGLFGFHIFTVLMLVLGIVVFGFMWRVSNRPYNIGFAKTYIQDALYDSETGNHVLMDKVVLFWPDFSGPMFIQFRGSQILNRDGNTLVSVDDVAMSFSVTALFAGKVMPKKIVVKQPMLHVLRLEDQSFDFGFGESNDDDGGADQESMIARILGYLARPGQENAHDSVLSRLEALEIKNARLVVSDYVSGVSWYVPDFTAGFFSTPTGLQANFDLDLPQGAGEISGINLDVQYDWEKKTADLTADIRQFDLMVLTGKMPELQVFKDMHKIVNARIEGHLGQGFVPEKLSGSIDLDGVRINSDVLFSKNESGVITGKANVSIDEVAQSKMDGLWPNALRGDAAEKWIVKNMADGVFKNIWASAELDFPVASDGGIDVHSKNVMAGFSFENMSVEYRHPLTPVTKVYGKGSFDLARDEMKIDIARGYIGDMKILSADLYFDQLVAEGVGGVDMNVKLDAKVQDALRYITLEPINMADRLDMDLDKVRGDGVLDLNLKFPTHPDLKKEEIKIKINGTIKDVVFPKVVSGQDVTGGPMTLSVKDGTVGVKGAGKLAGRDMNFEWGEFLNSDGKPYKSKVSAQMVVDEDLRKLFGIDLSDILTGDIGAKIVYLSYKNDTSDIDIEADLTPSVFFVKPFEFNKPAGEPAQAKMMARMEKKELRELTKLTAKGKNFSLSPSAIQFKKVDGLTQLWSGTLSHFTLGETKGGMSFQFDKNGTANIVFDSEFLDVQPFMAVKDTQVEYKEPPMVISVNAKVMKTAPTESVQNAKLFMDIDGQGRFNRLEMDATAGKGQIYLRFKPDKEGKRVFNLQSDDAGAALKAFQVYNEIRGGKMVIYGEPIRGVLDRNIIGAAEITDFNVVNAPVLTQLLSLMSLSGIADLLTGEGLNFSRLEADFNWTYRKEGALLTLKNGRTSGNSIGLTFDGTFDNAKRVIDVGGTVVPISSINGFLGKVPLVGDILTGGSGGIFAATYSIKGTSDKVDVSVNPLSVLTPGIIRTILFEN